MTRFRSTVLTSILALMVSVLVGVTPAAAAPANDDLANATVFSLTDSSPLAGTNVGATAEVDEPDHANQPPGTSVWWRFTAPENGDVTLSTAGSDFDTVLAAYTGSTMASLVEVASDDDTVGLTSQVDFSVTGSTTYQVAVAGYGGVDEGSIVLAFDWVPGGIEPHEPPANDDFADAITFDLTSPGPLTGWNVLATAEEDEPSHLSYETEPHSVWWKFTAPFRGDVHLSTAGSDFLTVLAVYTGPSLGELESVYHAYHDDTPTAFSVQPGETYYVAITGEDGETGDIQLGWAWTEADPQGIIVVESPLGTPAGSLDLGTAAVRGSRTKTLYVRNVGNAPLTITNLQIDSREFAAGEYRVVSNGAATPIPAGEYRQIVVAFEPTSTPPGSPTVVEYEESFPGPGRLSLDYNYSGGILVSIDVYTYIRNTGGAGDVDWTSVISYPTGIGVTGEADGSAALTGGDAYAMVTPLYVFGTTTADAQLDLTVSPDFTFRHIFESNYPGGPGFSGIGPSRFNRLEDALLTIESDDPETQASDPAGTLVSLFGETLTSGTTPPDGTDRWAGSNRYATAADVAAQTHPNGADTVLIATGANYPDALAGGPAGATLDAPILLTGTTTLPQPTITELQRLNPTRIIVLGGTSVISDTILTQLRTYAGTVDRWAGSNRYATAADVAAQTHPNGADTVLIATGANYPDALAGGPAGATLDAPILLTGTTTLPQPTITELQRLNPTRIIVLGGTSVISDAILTQLRTYAGTVDRWAGSNRYATAADVAAQTHPNGADTVLIATGANYPDALAGGPAGATLDAPILLTGTTTLPQPTITELQRLNPTRIIVLGGTSVISDAILTQLGGLTS